VFGKILIANRGEIACRIARTARRLGVRTVAVFSQADAGALHVRVADEAIAIGPPAARESYLRTEALIEAARRSGAEAVHPGYGFLSENADFAEACARAGIAFIGPPAAAIRAMGSKSEAKALMQRHGVPLLPGYHGEEQTPEALAVQAARVGYPVLIKASAGGGGKGMRRVDAPADFAAALAACQREAAGAFGDARVLIERLLLRPRHIEIQVFADTRGNAVHLFERDCSVQRRHQKVLEEAPAPGMGAARRALMCEAAIVAARAVGYVGAGTVEFIVAPSGEFYFMEMNTRLQVEHPVTEMISGQDLVEWQLRVAACETLPLSQAQLRIRGHAIEARLYAEDPAKGFLPATGQIRTLRFPTASDSVRIDAGVAEGDAISPWYDPMIAKLIVWGETREMARRCLAEALGQCRILGPANNLQFLGRVVASRSFAAADLDTALIEREQAALFPPETAAPDAALAAAALAVLQARRERCAHGPGLAVWRSPSAWRLNAPAEQRLRLRSAGTETEARMVESAEGWSVEFGSAQASAALPPERASRAGSGVAVAIRLGEERLQAEVFLESGRCQVFLPGAQYRVEIVDPLAHVGAAQIAEGGVRALMPGRIVALLAAAGARVKQGEPLLILEAMKMEHTLTAPANGVCEAFNCAVGDQVPEGAELVSFRELPD
jgi:3-methylcrotonyl-CoA carboxylase alpha subunit